MAKAHVIVSIRGETTEESIQRRSREPCPFSLLRLRVREVLVVLRRRTGFDLRSTRDPEGRSSTTERAHSRRRRRYARRSPDRNGPFRQSPAAPAAALPPSKR